MLLLSNILFRTKLWHFIIEQEILVFFLSLRTHCSVEANSLLIEDAQMWDGMVSLYLSDSINRLIMEEQL